ncbi:MAG: FAD-dependent oxidoreductase [Gammaproteobacteria bacterium]
MSQTAPVVIIGSGMAGYAAAKALRKEGYTQKLSMISTDGGEMYAKPKLSNSLAMQKLPEQLIDATRAEISNDLDLDFYPYTLVEKIDIQAHKLYAVPAPQNPPIAPDLVWRQHGIEGATIQHGQPIELDYSSLILATGSAPVRLPLELIAPSGSQAEICSINSLNDYIQFRNHLQKRKISKALVIGPGLVGCEFANDLLTQNIQVDILGPDPWPMSLLIPENPGNKLKQALEKAGARWHLNTQLKAPIYYEDGLYRTVLPNGDRIETELILSAAGIRPEVQLAKTSGLTVNAGICTDSYLRTSAPDIYALGDCAEITGRVRLFVQPIRIAAAALAKTLTNNPSEAVFPPISVGVKTSLHPVNMLLAEPGSARKQDQWHCTLSEDGCWSRYYDSDGILKGFVLTGDQVAKRQEMTAQVTATH